VYRAAFQAAFKEAIKDLSPRERTLLRQRFAFGLSAEEIGTIYRVSRMTAHRWLERARTRLLAGTRKRLKQRLAVDGTEFESIMRLIQSRLDVSIHSALAGEDAD
jgi:RNA polymerase sigma-70 factor (ECF subfamily)